MLLDWVNKVTEDTKNQQLLMVRLTDKEQKIQRWNNIMDNLYDKPILNKQEKGLKHKHFRHSLFCNGELKRRSGKFGAFLGCSKYPNCKYSEPL